MMAYSGDEPAPRAAPKTPPESAILSFWLVLLGIACQVLLVKVLPMTGLGVLLSVPMGVGCSIALALGYFFYSRRQPTVRARLLTFALFVLAVILLSIALHPQDYGGSAFGKLWLLLTE